MSLISNWAAISDYYKQCPDRTPPSRAQCGKCVPWAMPRPVIETLLHGLAWIRRAPRALDLLPRGASCDPGLALGLSWVRREKFSSTVRIHTDSQKSRRVGVRSKIKTGKNPKWSPPILRACGKIHSCTALHVRVL